MSIDFDCRDHEGETMINSITINNDDEDNLNDEHDDEDLASGGERWERCKE